MQRCAAGKAGSRDEMIPFGKLDQTVDHRPRIGLDEAWPRRDRKAVEHIDYRLPCNRSHPPRFRQMRDEEGLAAGGRQHRGDLLEADAIGVGLDHGGAFARHHARQQHLVVGGDGAEIDGQDAVGFMP